MELLLYNKMLISIKRTCYDMVMLMVTFARKPRASSAECVGLKSSGTASVTKETKSASIPYRRTSCCCMICHRTADMRRTGGTRRRRDGNGRGSEKERTGVRTPKSLSLKSRHNFNTKDFEVKTLKNVQVNQGLLVVQNTRTQLWE